MSCLKHSGLFFLFLIRNTNGLLFSFFFFPGVHCVQHYARTREACTYLSSFCCFLFFVQLQECVTSFFLFLHGLLQTMHHLGPWILACGQVLCKVCSLFLGKSERGEKKKLLKVCSCLVEEQCT